MLRIPLFYVKDKQAFDRNMHLIGKPVDVAKKLAADGYKLLHIIDLDARKGLGSNLDLYNNLTFFINVEVECFPNPALIKKLLNFKCRVVLAPEADVSAFSENKKLLVARIPKGSKTSAENFHDVILEEQSPKSIARFIALGKRVIVYDSDNLKDTRDIWGAIFEPKD